MTVCSKDAAAEQAGQKLFMTIIACSAILAARWQSFSRHDLNLPVSSTMVKHKCNTNLCNLRKLE